MNTVSFFVLLAGAITKAQDICAYSAGSGNYELNLTSVSAWTLEYQGDTHWYYYTPCRNSLTCLQGNANFLANTAQYLPGENQCSHYLSVDHHQQPQYSFVGASWRFSYADGELCESTQKTRSTTIYWHCNNVNNLSPARLETAYESSTCDYYYSVASTLACVDENRHNENCQWRVPSGTGGYHYLDLSDLQGEIVFEEMSNGYDLYYSICSNKLPCYQQHNRQVMSVIDNSETKTCELTLGVWEDGAVQPLLHQSEDVVHWTFHFYNGGICSSGSQSAQKIRYFCDETVDTYKVLGAYGEGNCLFDLNISTKAACLSTEPRWIDAKSLF